MLVEFEGRRPKVHPTAYIAPTAVLIGSVEVGAHSSVWHGAVLRGDWNRIRIGKYTSFQDNCVAHCSHEPGLDTVVGDYCTIGHGATIHSCRIGNRVLVGMNAVIFNGARVGDGSMIGMGAVVPANTIIGRMSVAVGVPAKVVRRVTREEFRSARSYAENYAKMAERHRREEAGGAQRARARV